MVQGLSQHEPQSRALLMSPAPGRTAVFLAVSWVRQDPWAQEPGVGNVPTADFFFFNFLSFYENNTGTECKMGFKLKCIESGNTAFSVEGKSCLIRTQHMPKCPCGEHTHGRQGRQCIIMQCGNRRCDLLSLSLKCTPAVHLASDQARCDRFSVLHCLCLSVHLQPGL